MENKSENSVTEIAKRLKAMADTGLLYVENDYDKERYEELLQLSYKLMQMHSGNNINFIEGFFDEVIEYPTPQVDVRGFLLNAKNEVLLVKEKSDSKWTIPGGWCEVGLTPKENISKEMKEETGLDVKVERILAVFDKKCHPHPPQAHYVYKLVYLCSSQDGMELNPNHEILDAAYFPLNNLPELSTDRILKNQLEILFQKIISNDNSVYSD